MKPFVSKISINFSFYLFSFFLISALKSENTKKEIKENRKECYLTKSKSMDPFPSLSRCYKYNNEACCTSVHDEFISEYIEQILPMACLRKYSDFENLMCFGCHPLSSNYLEIEENNPEGQNKKIIRICKKFLKTLWNATLDEDLSKPTRIFDNCGFKADLNELKNFKDAKYIIPSEVFNGIEDFFKFIKIPFYEDFVIVIQDETNENCYNVCKKNETMKFWIWFLFFDILFELF